MIFSIAILLWGLKQESDFLYDLSSRFTIARYSPRVLLFIGLYNDRKPCTWLRSLSRPNLFIPVKKQLSVAVVILDNPDNRLSGKQ